MMQLEKVALPLLLASVASCVPKDDPLWPSHCPASTPSGASARTAPIGDTPPMPSLCSVFVCGDNAPTSGDGFLFDEINECGAPNYAGVRITGARRPAEGGGTVPVAVGVDRHFFYAREADGTEHRGAALKDTIVSFRHADGAAFEMRFEDFSDHQNDQLLAFAAGAQEAVPSYVLKVRRVGEGENQERFVCNHDMLVNDPLWSASLRHHALVFRGDRYDPVAKTLLESNADSPWGFLACAGGAGAKLHLYRHTLAGSLRYGGGAERFETSPDERTTLIKAITADYCGRGVEDEFTVPGQPLRFAANKPWFPPPDLSPGGVASIEGVWGPEGLRCLDMPRRVERSMIPCASELPTCGDISNWQGRGYAITANPR